MTLTHILLVVSLGVFPHLGLAGGLEVFLHSFGLHRLQLPDLGKETRRVVFLLGDGGMLRLGQLLPGLPAGLKPGEGHDVDAEH